MAKSPKITNAAANIAVDALAPELNSGVLRVYSGDIPATADTALVAQVAIAELTFGATAFGAAVNGVATANAITADADAVGGTAAFFRAFKTGGTTVVTQGTVGAADADMIVSSVTIAAGAEVQCNSMTLTLPVTG